MNLRILVIIYRNKRIFIIPESRIESGSCLTPIPEPNQTSRLDGLRDLIPCFFRSYSRSIICNNDRNGGATAGATATFAGNDPSCVAVIAVFRAAYGRRTSLGHALGRQFVKAVGGQRELRLAGRLLFIQNRQCHFSFLLCNFFASIRVEQKHHARMDVFSVYAVELGE